MFILIIYVHHEWHSNKQKNMDNVNTWYVMNDIMITIIFILKPMITTHYRYK